jgi:hypothetical protein
MTDKKEEKPTPTEEKPEEKKPEDKFFGKLFKFFYLILDRAEKKSGFARKSITG